MCLPICVKGHFAGMNLRGLIFAFESVQKEIPKNTYIYIHLLYFIVEDVFATQHWEHILYSSIHCPTNIRIYKSTCI